MSGSADPFSMGNALELSGAMQGMVQDQSQALEQAKANVDQAKGANANNKRAAWVKAHAAKLDAARAAMDVRLAGAERGYATTKTLLNFSLKMFGYVAGGMSDQKSNADRARAAVENGAAAKERLSVGGKHDKAIGEQLDFSKQQKEIKERRDGISSELATLQSKHANGENWSIEDQELAQNLRMEDMNLQHQGELLAGLAQARAAGAFGQTQVTAQAERWDGNTQKSTDSQGNTKIGSTANVSDYLRKQGFDNKQLSAMQEYSRLQEQANELRTERKEIKSRLAESGEKYNQSIETAQDPFMSGLQTELDEVLLDQMDVKTFDAAAKYVTAMDDYDRLKRQEESGLAVDPAEMAKARFEMGKGEAAFDATRNRPMNERAGWEIFSTVVGDMIGFIDQMKQINRSYVDAQARLSSAAEQAGNAMEQAKDMELS